MKRGIQLVTGVVMLCGMLAGSQAEDQSSPLSAVPVTRDLAADALLGMSEHLPLLLVFMQDHCDYCVKLDHEILNPNYASGAFKGKAIVRRFMIDSFMIDSYATVIDFDGKKVDASALASRFKVYATPTLVLVDAHGRELVQRIVGVDSFDFFAAYLDESIEQARAKLPPN